MLKGKSQDVPQSGQLLRHNILNEICVMASTHFTSGKLAESDWWHLPRFDSQERMKNKKRHSLISQSGYPCHRCETEGVLPLENDGA